jgi:hypothetical protein
MLKTVSTQARRAANNFRAYSERRQRAEHYAQQDAFVRADILAIRRYFLGTTRLSDEADERFLHALLLKGLPATQVLDLFPWARHRGVDYYIDRANADRRTPDADRLGELIEFEFDDLMAMKREGYSVRHVAPYDAQRGDVQEFWAAEEQEADRERKQRDRDRRKESTMPKISRRAKQVHKVLRDNRWISVSDIMEAVELRDQRKRKLAPAVLRVAVHRALDELVASGVAEEKTEAGTHHFPTRFARRSHMTGQVSVSDNIATDNKKTSGDVASQ